MITITTKEELTAIADIAHSRKVLANTLTKMLNDSRQLANAIDTVLLAPSHVLEGLDMHLKGLLIQDPVRIADRLFNKRVLMVINAITHSVKLKNQPTNEEQ